MKKTLIGPRVIETLSRGMSRVSPIIDALYGPNKGTVVSRLNGRPVMSTYFTGLMDTFSLPDKLEDVGIRVFRDVINQVREKSGSGSGIAAVLAMAIIRAGNKLLTAGMSHTELMSYLDAMQTGFSKHLVVKAEQVGKDLHVREVDAYSGVAATVTGDVEISKLMSEVFSHIGEFGNLEMRRGHSLDLKAEYVSGFTFKTSAHSYKLLKGAKKLDLENARVLITDARIEYDKSLVDLLVACNKSGNPLVVMCDGFDTHAMELILHNVMKGAIQVLAIRPPSFDYDRTLALKDIAFLTNGEFISKDDPYKKLEFSKLGLVPKVTFDGTSCTLIHGKNDGIAEYIAAINSAPANKTDLLSQKRVKERVGNVQGKSAIVTIGGSCELDRDAKYYSAECAAHAVRGAMQEGVIPGGCQVFYDYAVAVEKSGEVPATLAKAMSEPFRAVLKGHAESKPFAEFVAEGATHGYDISAGCIRGMLDSGVVDSVKAIRIAAESALSIAKTVLGSGAIVLEV